MNAMVSIRIVGATILLGKLKGKYVRNLEERPKGELYSFILYLGGVVVWLFSAAGLAKSCSIISYCPDIVMFSWLVLAVSPTLIASSTFS